MFCRCLVTTLLSTPNNSARRFWLSQNVSSLYNTSTLTRPLGSLYKMMSLKGMFLSSIFYLICRFLFDMVRWLVTGFFMREAVLSGFFEGSSFSFSFGRPEACRHHTSSRRPSRAKTSRQQGRVLTSRQDCGNAVAAEHLSLAELKINAPF